jgi:hypothetical protein
VVCGPEARLQSFRGGYCALAYPLVLILRNLPVAGPERRHPLLHHSAVSLLVVCQRLILCRTALRFAGIRTDAGNQETT